VVALFKEKSITGVFFLLLLCGITHAHALLVVHSFVPLSDTGLISFFLQQYIYKLPSSVITLIYFATIIIQSIRLNVVLNEWKMFTVTGFTTAMSYILLSGFFSDWGFVSPALIANSFVIWVFECLCKLYNHNNSKSLLFNIGLIVGASILCYQPLVILIVVVFFALMVIRPFIISEWVVLLLGIVLPFYVIVSFFYLNDRTMLISAFLPRIHFQLPKIMMDFWMYSKLTLLLIMTVIGFNFWSKYNTRMVIQIRKNWSILVVMLLLMLPIVFLSFEKGFLSSWLLLVPFAAFISNAFLYPKNSWVTNILFVGCIIIIMYNNYSLLGL
jgi:Family of unknown function (DUF6427)